MITREESDRRLLVLADFLEKLPPERFYYGLWIGDDWGGKQDLSCGTTACAMGWAPSIPEFAALGLRRTKVGGDACVTHLKRARGEDLSLRAADFVFGLDRNESTWLFIPRSPPPGGIGLYGWGPNSEATATEVASHIRRFVKARKEAGE